MYPNHAMTMNPYTPMMQTNQMQGMMPMHNMMPMCSMVLWKKPISCKWKNYVERRSREIEACSFNFSTFFISLLEIL